MNHQSTLLFAFCLTSMLFHASCSTTNNISATTPASGYHKGKYYLSESEKNLTAEQLQLRIKEEARICANPGSHKIKESPAGTAVQFGVGLALGLNINRNSQDKTPAVMARARMKAYSDRLVELGQPPVNIDGEIKAALAERNTPPAESTPLPEVAIQPAAA